MINQQQVEHAVAIVRAAGGTVVGRTKMQKIAYLLTAAGFEEAFSFEYKHYGPYSEDLSTALEFAGLLNQLQEVQNVAAWGGKYSVYSTPITNEENDPRTELARAAKNADAIQLELAATALYLFKSGVANPWAETERRKPEKTQDGRLTAAKALYNQLRAIVTPSPLPAL